MNIKSNTQNTRPAKEFSKEEHWENQKSIWPLEWTDSSWLFYNVHEEFNWWEMTGVRSSLSFSRANPFSSVSIIGHVRQPIHSTSTAHYVLPSCLWQHPCRKFINSFKQRHKHVKHRWDLFLQQHNGAESPCLCVWYIISIFVFKTLYNCNRLQSEELWF